MYKNYWDVKVPGTPPPWNLFQILENWIKNLIGDNFVFNSHIYENNILLNGNGRKKYRWQ